MTHRSIYLRAGDGRWYIFGTYEEKSTLLANITSKKSVSVPDMINVFADDILSAQLAITLDSANAEEELNAFIYTPAERRLRDAVTHAQEAYDNAKARVDAIESLFSIDVEYELSAEERKEQAMADANTVEQLTKASNIRDNARRALSRAKEELDSFLYTPTERRLRGAVTQAQDNLASAKKRLDAIEYFHDIVDVCVDDDDDYRLSASEERAMRKECAMREAQYAENVMRAKLDIRWAREALARAEAELHDHAEQDDQES